MAYSKGQSVVVPTAPNLCFKLSTTKSVCGIHGSATSPRKLCRPGYHPPAAGHWKMLPGKCWAVHVCLQEGHSCRGWPGEELGSPSELPSAFMSHCDREAGSGQDLTLSRPHHASSFSPSMALDCPTHVTSWCKAAAVHSSSCRPQQERNISFPHASSCHMEYKQDPNYSNANSLA